MLLNRRTAVISRRRGNPRAKLEEVERLRLDRSQQVPMIGDKD